MQEKLEKWFSYRILDIRNNFYHFNFLISQLFSMHFIFINCAQFLLIRHYVYSQDMKISSDFHHKKLINFDYCRWKLFDPMNTLCLGISYECMACFFMFYKGFFVSNWTSFISHQGCHWSSGSKCGKKSTIFP